MADTRGDLTIPEAVWTDLYAASGIAVGTAVNVYNKGSRECRIAIKATAPGDTTRGITLYVGPSGSSFSVAAAATGLWAYVPKGTGLLLVQE